MLSKSQVTFSDRRIQLTVCIPIKNGEDGIAWRFMREFSTKFAECRKVYPDVIRQVDGYINRVDSWDITVTIPEHLEDRFYDFVRKFCQEHGLNMQNPPA